ncbi:hypothetical protein FQZ97_1061470 [compost metagenome]
MPALDQGEEVLGGVQGLVDTQLAGLVGLGQQRGHFPQYLLRPRLVEHSGQLRVLVGHGHHHPMQLHGFAAVDQLVEAPADVQQHAFDAGVRRQLEQQLG